MLINDVQCSSFTAQGSQLEVRCLKHNGRSSICEMIKAFLPLTNLCRYEHCRWMMNDTDL